MVEVSNSPNSQVYYFREINDFFAAKAGRVYLDESTKYFSDLFSDKLALAALYAGGLFLSSIVFIIMFVTHRGKLQVQDEKIRGSELVKPNVMRTLLKKLSKEEKPPMDTNKHEWVKLGKFLIASG